MEDLGMKGVLYLTGITIMADGALNLLFPRRWNALWAAESRNVLPPLGERYEDWLDRCPTSTWRVKGLAFIAIGATLLYLPGAVD